MTRPQHGVYKCAKKWLVFFEGTLRGIYPTKARASEQFRYLKRYWSTKKPHVIY